MTGGFAPVQRRYLELVDAIETRFDVAHWRSGDIDLWPPARMDLYLDMFRATGGETQRPAPSFVPRVAGALATPLVNAWKSRTDLRHWRPWPRRAYAMLLGDGVSLDKIDGAWRDRHGEPVMAALETMGLSTFLMQPGGLNRLPWGRPTFPANTVAVRGALSATLGPKRPIDLPDYDAVARYLHDQGVDAPSLNFARLVRRAGAIAGSARRFERLLHAVKPQVAFVVTYYAGLGHAFALACRRQGVLCVDLQHCPQEGAHRAYRWSSLPDGGYSTMPAVFWTWSAAEAAHIAAWPGNSPWRRTVHGGHSQLSAFLDDQGEAVRRWDARWRSIGDPAAFTHEILVALQPIGERRQIWDALARQIEAAPKTWRWWIRRHPSSTRFQDTEYERLLALKQDNVLIEEASELPLPALLRHMNALVSLASGAAAEAETFNVPAFFMDSEALGTFSGLIGRGAATLIDVVDVTRLIADLPRKPPRTVQTPPPLAATLLSLGALAEEYAQMWRAQPPAAG